MYTKCIELFKHVSHLLSYFECDRDFTKRVKIFSVCNNTYDDCFYASSVRNVRFPSRLFQLFGNFSYLMHKYRVPRFPRVMRNLHDFFIVCEYCRAIQVERFV